jgi:transposase
VQKGDVESFALAHLPIVKEYASRIGFVELVDRMVASGMHVAPGKVLLGLVMNLLCGRSPLYRVEEFFRSRDVALLLGEEMTAGLLSDDTIGRVLDRVYAYGTWKIFSEVCLETFRNFHVDASVVHQDTTSVSVWGEYLPAPGDPIRITNGYSKDKRPDLKQFVLSLLCVEGNLPCHAGILDGNASDKKTNGRILNELPRIMTRHGLKEFIYVADSALITKDNLALMTEGIDCIARLPETFGACGRLINAAVASGPWQDVGHLAHRNVRGKEVSARYRLQEKSLDLYGRTYRAVVVHSDVHDRRRQKRIDSAIRKDASAVKATASALTRKEFFCLPDAEAAAQALKDGTLHHVSSSVASRPVYGRGRPAKSGIRPVQGIRYRVLATVGENTAAVDKLREEAGCFVLLTTVPRGKKSGRDILRIYKEQDGIERNFAFLKDPLVANDVFLKKPHRIEAMGLLLVLSLLLWRLMERTMRRKAREGITLQGWNNTDTTRPTSFMMVSKFSPVFVGVKEGRRFLFTPLDTVQLAYLMALDVHPAIFTEVRPRTDSNRSRSP